MFELRCYQRLFLESSQGEEFFLACPGPSGICFKACLFTALCRWGFVPTGILFWVSPKEEPQKRETPRWKIPVERFERFRAGAFSLFNLFVKRVFALVAAVLHEF
jgi:hypothetical protein